MSVFTVHEPPLRPVDASPDPGRFVFVRDGFSLWAFVVTALWMLWHRMWLVLVLYLVVVAGIDAAIRYAGASTAIVSIVDVLLSFLIGIEAGTLRRFALARRGWKSVGIVSGDNFEEAELRFFDAWVRQPPKRTEPVAGSPSLPPAPQPRAPHSPDVIGLFPEPGANR